MRFVEAFKSYGATLKNPRWSVCAENKNGELVISLWKHHFSPAVSGTITCKDVASRWTGNGNKEFRESIQKAYDTDQVIRVVMVRTDDTEAVERGEDASQLKTQFYVKPDWYGKVVYWDGENYEIEFTSNK